ncbi:UDP-2,4-diacetamido-2,4,6-trideoxy-beta-L-altropyranose hydrolase [Clostridium fermenticellae]|uniref:UDP-2,4-diacetamido-2,4, 6-trideoxy-beta-L-altropyranose hydrolase n=1 Tax=Clostridium fermenticellae TaxID=2068654 RepID=A0A386H595_9CLOT|nr:UDP-2,4-diacetamido-2,4,6-trideoxy-beta-L-altropyranose hydrolase [Clostridium fermenticellae]AYD40703.1 UDP-2,4-diacetamido-2,4,6-trideoxy-beta-L-altropyranose hydrolase [Clostridium fermenticellae]
MNIAIRAEGGSKVGMGHIMRTLVLAKELSLKNKVYYLCKDTIDNKGGIIKIQENKFKVFTFKESILEVLSNVNTELLITDSYDVNERYFIQTKNIVKHTVYIDDINSFDYPVDLLINQNINARGFNYRQKYKLLGLKYLMIREEFRNLPEKRINEQAKDIMITMGGSDIVNFTKILLKWIKNLNFSFHVVIGPSFQNINYFESIHESNIEFYFNANMAEIMKKCDIAVSAAGSSMYELLASGVPSLSVITADNQVDVARKLGNMNISESLLWYNKLSKNVFIDKLNCLCNNYTLRKEESAVGQKLIDGFGTKRIADFINSNFKN